METIHRIGQMVYVLSALYLAYRVMHTGSDGIDILIGTYLAGSSIYMVVMDNLMRRHERLIGRQNKTISVKNRAIENLFKYEAVNKALLLKHFQGEVSSDDILSIMGGKKRHDELMKITDEYYGEIERDS